MAAEAVCAYRCSMDILIRGARQKGPDGSRSSRVALAGLAALLAVGAAAKAKLAERGSAAPGTPVATSAAAAPKRRDAPPRPGFKTLLLPDGPAKSHAVASRPTERFEAVASAPPVRPRRRVVGDGAEAFARRHGADGARPGSHGSGRVRQVGMQAGLALAHHGASAAVALGHPAFGPPRRPGGPFSPPSRQAFLGARRETWRLPSSSRGHDAASAYQREVFETAAAAPEPAAPFIGAEPGLSQAIAGTGTAVPGPAREPGAGEGRGSAGGDRREVSGRVLGGTAGAPSGELDAGLGASGSTGETAEPAYDAADASGSGVAEADPPVSAPPATQEQGPASASPQPRPGLEVYVDPGSGPIPYRVRGDATGLLFPDISKWQPDEEIDWAALDAASNGVIVMKVIQGSEDWDVDPEFHKHLEQAESRGMIVIGYAFGTRASGAAQADAVLRHFPAEPGRAVMLDWEPDPDGVEMTESQAIDFVNRIKEVTGRYPILYSTAWKPRPGVLAECPRYYARWYCYGRDSSEPCDGPQSPPSVYDVAERAPEGAEVWQFTNGLLGPLPNRFPGIGNSDVNMLMVTYDELRSWAGLDPTLASR